MRRLLPSRRTRISRACRASSSSAGSCFPEGPAAAAAGGGGGRSSGKTSWNTSLGLPGDAPRITSASLIWCPPPKRAGPRWESRRSTVDTNLSRRRSAALLALRRLGLCGAAGVDGSPPPAERPACCALSSSLAALSWSKGQEIWFLMYRQYLARSWRMSAPWAAAYALGRVTATSAPTDMSLRGVAQPAAVQCPSIGMLGGSPFVSAVRQPLELHSTAAAAPN
mmetsp:Transcript_39012/g.124166  ORF Transcript_39012/g.124166 Transcript_39012/m.124166 type:complete len:224 (+) Transcript_39012:294-965(+)